MQFTKAAIAALAVPVGKAEFFEWDDDLPGLGIRLRSAGSKTWVAQYRVAGRQRRESLGDVRKITVEDARRIARQRFAQVQLGLDPRAGHKATLSLHKAVALYLGTKQDRLRRSSFTQAEYHFGKLWKPLLDRPLGEIKRAEIAATLQMIVKNHGRTSASRARSNLSALFGWAVKEGIVEFNPVLATNNPAEGIQARERVLDDGEIAAIWGACRDDDFGRIVRLLLLTGCRREEIGGLRWDELDAAGTLVIAGARTKNGRTLTLPLPPAALDILRSIPRQESSELVFPAGKPGNTFCAWSYCKMALDARIAMARGRPLERWTLHDLRRTCRTGLSKLGIPPHVAELCINHAKGGIQAVYDKYAYAPQIGAALAAWAAHVEMIVSPKSDTVVPLRA